MTLSRRSFLVGSSALLAAGLARGRMALADADESCPLLFTVHLDGGWDPAMFIDPDPRPQFNQLTSDIADVGGIRYAPTPIPYDNLGYGGANFDALASDLLSHDEFVQRNAEHMLVLNGVDHQTVAHGIGVRYAWSGKAKRDTPSLSTLVAATHGGGAVVPLMAGGGYHITGGLAPMARFASQDAAAAAFAPNTGLDGDTPYVADWVEELIAQELASRAQAGIGRAPGPERASREWFASVREGGRVLQDMPLVALPQEQIPAIHGRSEVLLAQTILSAMAAGHCVAGGLQYSGWDTHIEHDRRYSLGMGKLLRMLDAVVTLAKTAGLFERLVIIVAGDFARGPHESTGWGSGKNHWSVSSMLLLGGAIGGGRAVGATTDAHLAIPVDPVSLEQSSTGVLMTPANVHAALRARLGVDPAIARRVGFPDEVALPLFG